MVLEDFFVIPPFCVHNPPVKQGDSPVKAKLTKPKASDSAMVDLS